VRIFNTNTSKVIHSHFAVSEENHRLHYQPQGSYTIDGVSGQASCVTLSFQSPGGAKTGKVFPTGSPVSRLKLSDGSSVSASCVDIANPGVFVRASDLGVNLSNASPAVLEGNEELMGRFEEVRQAGAIAMGLDPTVQSVPKIVLLEEPAKDDSSNIVCLALSMGRVHKASPLTLALNLGVNANLPGTVAHHMKRKSTDDSDAETARVRIRHPSGMLDVAADVREGEVHSVSLTRTARMLMKGQVNCD
jgi:hypothetical protein